MKEGDIQRGIFEYLTKAGHLPIRMYLGAVRHSGGSKSKNPNKGMPDLFFLNKDRSGRVFFIEVKAPSGRLSEDQKIWLKRLEGWGAKCLVARSLNDVVQWLN